MKKSEKALWGFGGMIFGTVVGFVGTKWNKQIVGAASSAWTTVKGWCSRKKDNGDDPSDDDGDGAE